MPSKSRPKPRYIPFEVLSPFVREYVDSREMGVVQYARPEREMSLTSMYQDGGMKAAPQTYSAMDALAFEAGVQTATVRMAYNGAAYPSKRKYRPHQGLKFSTVDKLLTAMGMMYLWYEPPLDEYYELMA